jgi:hypothetical protein
VDHEGLGLALGPHWEIRGSQRPTVRHNDNATIIMPGIILLTVAGGLGMRSIPAADRAARP